ncbi:MAG TPA: hypothetical protein DGT23_10035, partial [Micromonosporaceae bacterium]|nr:hypothetical protein [Micromonosporaceae bacterium]
WESVYAYDGDKTVTLKPPAGGTATTTIKDVRGNTVQLLQHLGGVPTGSVDATTTYTYDRLGQLTKVTDVAGNEWKYEYDRLGRKTKAIDPDTGTFTNTYDNAGQITETLDGNLTKLVYKHDQLGRKTELRETSATGTLRASWTYDPAGAKAHPASATRYDTGGPYVSTINEYDDAYRIKKVTYSIPGFAAGGGALSYAIENTYTANGMPLTRKLPAAASIPTETITFGYNTVGMATSMANDAGQTYVNSTEYHYDGLIYRQYLGNTDKRARVSTVFDPVTRRLTGIWNSVETTPGSFQVPYDYSYSYDHAGNIKSIAGNVHGVPDQEECFTYDHLQRLTEAWTQTSGTCATPQRTGADPYRRQWTFDKLGNRLTQKDLDATNTDWTYTVGGTDGCGGGAKPHTVASISASGPKAGTPTRTFCYDAAGHTTQRTTESGASQSLAWDKEGHLQSVTEGGSLWSYVYDVDGNRLIGRAPTGDTLYLPDGTEIKKLTGGQLEAHRYYGHTGKTIAVRTGASLTWIAVDHHGTQQTQIAASNLSYQRRRSMPYGEPRGTQPGFTGTQSYVGGTKDDTGLIHIGAREYDSSLGRFISDDPFTDFSDPQTIHGYSYSKNSPVTFADPTGEYTIEGLTDCGCGTIDVADPLNHFFNRLEKTPGVIQALTVGAFIAVGHAAAGIFRSEPASAEAAANAAGVEGTLEGAEELVDLAIELQNTREGIARDKGTTAVIKVWDATTGKYIIKVAVETSSISEMPEGWEEIIRKTVGAEIEIQFVPSKGNSRHRDHAEETIIESLGDTQVIVEGGASRNVCVYQCNAEMKPNIQLGGRTWAWRPPVEKTPFRAFWRNTPHTWGFVPPWGYAQW